MLSHPYELNMHEEPCARDVCGIWKSRTKVFELRPYFPDVNPFCVRGMFGGMIGKWVGPLKRIGSIIFWFRVGFGDDSVRMLTDPVDRLVFFFLQILR